MHEQRTMSNEPATPADEGVGEPSGPVARIRLRLGPTDSRYAPDLVAGGLVMTLFGDLETELAIREYGDEGLCVAYHGVEFLAPLHVGDFVEGRAWVTGTGRTSRRIHAELHKVIEATGDGAARVLEPPLLAARADATIVSGRRPKATRDEVGDAQQ
jgi:acyl-CoA hydrolase